MRCAMEVCYSVMQGFRSRNRKIDTSPHRNKSIDWRRFKRFYFRGLLVFAAPRISQGSPHLDLLYIYICICTRTRCRYRYLFIYLSVRLYSFTFIYFIMYNYHFLFVLGALHRNELALLRVWIKNKWSFVRFVGVLRSAEV